MPPLARSALTVVDAGCKLWGKGGDEATKLITSGCSTWNEIGMYVKVAYVVLANLFLDQVDAPLKTR